MSTGKGVVLITGASRGIGRGIALELARRGYDIAGLSTRPDPSNTETGLYAVKREAETLGVRFLPLAGDVADLEGHERILDELYAGFGRLDMLVSNAGVAPLQRVDILTCAPESFDRLMNINLRGPFFLAQHAALRMLDQPARREGAVPKIVFISSISSRAASANRAEYCISKAGLSMAAQCFAVGLARRGILVYDLQPGIIRTDMTAAVQEKYDRLIREGLLLTPRWGTPEDVGRAVAAIAEGCLDYSTGSAIEVGGGFGVQRL